MLFGIKRTIVRVIAGALPVELGAAPDGCRSAGECAGDGCRERFVRVIIPGSPIPKPEPRTGHPEARGSERPGELTRTIYRDTLPDDPDPPTQRPEYRLYDPDPTPAHGASAIVRLRRYPKLLG